MLSGQSWTMSNFLCCNLVGYDLHLGEYKKLLTSCTKADVEGKVFCSSLLKSFFLRTLVKDAALKYVKTGEMQTVFWDTMYVGGDNVDVSDYKAVTILLWAIFSSICKILFVLVNESVCVWMVKILF